ncbi:hypothetical protein TREPR_0873 [Treponema primitia ZAS-2]|uniref:Uncharacterized protein n=1 Tax=Treponema primitia (strain ATCC BAA-887 / DSM 12427 / ZAS-2) TaxID=545694 RepID=F5YIM4_TREPZ|nr:hypothetical protein TREPR_0873 [Treponema primitia ZAS-2]
MKNALAGTYFLCDFLFFSGKTAPAAQQRFLAIQSRVW